MEAYVILGWVVEKPTKQVRLRSTRHDHSGAGTAHQAVRQQGLLSGEQREEKAPDECVCLGEGTGGFQAAHMALFLISFIIVYVEVD